MNQWLLELKRIIDYIGSRAAIACARHDTPATWLSLPIKLAMIITEVVEAVEAHRTSDAPHRYPHKWEPSLPDKQAIALELADAIIRICEIGHSLDLPIAEQLLEKLDINDQRPYKHGGKLY